MTKTVTNKDSRITVRVTPYQMNVLEELKNGLDTSMAVIIRTIIGDWLTKNEEYVERTIINSKKEKEE